MEHPAPIRAVDLVVALRIILRLPLYDRPPTDDIPAHLPADLSVRLLHARWFVAWCVAGLELFAGRRPSMAAAILAARRTVATMAINDEVGQLDEAARSLRTGSTNLRRVLDEAGAWPWVDPADRDPPGKHAPWCSCTGEDGAR